MLGPEIHEYRWWEVGESGELFSLKWLLGVTKGADLYVYGRIPTYIGC